MRRMPPLAGVLVLFAFAALEGFAPSRVLAAPPELKKLHVLMVFDTDSNLTESLRVDEWRLRRLLLGHVPESRFALKVLTGKDVTREGILKEVAGLPLGAQDGVLVFYGGHGATDPDRGPYLQLRNGKPLLRSELRSALEARKAPLAVLLTDCCSTRIKLPRALKEKGGEEAALSIHPTFRCLFFQARGYVDITAATDTASWGDDDAGGIFTRALCLMLDRPVKDLDANRDGFVSWAEFFPALQKETELTFRSWSIRMRQRGEVVPASTQTPRQFSLGGEAPRPARSTYAVVGLENTSASALRYRVRWDGEAQWSGWRTLPSRKQEAEFKTVPEGNNDSPLMFIEFDGRKGSGKLRSRLWAGTGTPRFADGEQTRIRLNR